eukprot:2285983-Pleurochrysis_carterae.AAC.1
MPSLFAPIPPLFSRAPVEREVVDPAKDFINQRVHAALEADARRLLCARAHHSTLVALVGLRVVALANARTTARRHAPQARKRPHACTHERARSEGG